MSIPNSHNRRDFLLACAASAATKLVRADKKPLEPRKLGSLILNDDGYVFLNISDDLGKEDLRRYLQSYCRAGVDTIAYCVGTCRGRPSIRPGSEFTTRPSSRKTTSNRSASTATSITS